MRQWELAVELDPNREQPLFLQLASAISNDIRRGRLKPGDALPGSRELAESLGVTRNTVVAGYGELLAEGMVNTRVGGGTFVAKAMPVLRALPSVSDTPTYALAPSLHTRPLSVAPPAPGTLMLSLGLPDARLLPARVLARAFRRAIGRQGRTLLTYADPCGHVRLRTELAAMLSRTRGLPTTKDDILITRGIEQGIDLVARTLLAPGDVVAVEAFGYPAAWSVLKLAGARLIPVPLDDDGLDTAALERLLAQQPVRAVFVTPHHQFPTATVMSPARRVRLAQLALQHRFAIIEDDYDHEFHYDGKPVLPIAAGTGRANVIYLGSLANLLAPAACTAFVIAPPAVREQLRNLRAASDAKGDAAVECAIAELFEDGELLRHMQRMRRTYRSRRDALVASLARHLGSAVEFRVPQGGMALWARVDPSIDATVWASAAEREGVMICDSRRYHLLQRDASFLRLGFSYHDEAELDEAVQRMARALLRRTRPTEDASRSCIASTRESING